MLRGVVIAALLVLASVSAASSLSADEPAAVVVTVRGDRRIRVQVSEGIVRPCDSHDDRPLFDRSMAPGDVAVSSIGGDCICVRYTTGSFPNADWSTSGLVCRPRVCRAKTCRPAPDPTIRLVLP